MGSSVHFTFDEPVALDEWLGWAEPAGFAYSQNTIGGNTFYAGEVEVRFGHDNVRSRWQDNRPPQEAATVTVSTFFGGDLVSVADLAMSMWLRFGGAMEASPEIRALIVSHAIAAPSLPAGSPPIPARSEECQGSS